MDDSGLYVTRVCGTVRIVIRLGVRSEGIVVVAAQRDDIGAVCAIARHTVTTHKEAFERGITPLPVVVAEVTELGPGHQHQVSHDLGVVCSREFPLVILDPAETMVRIPGAVVDVFPTRH